MAQLILPQWYDAQPQEVAPVDPELGICFLLNPALGTSDLASGLQLTSVSGTPSMGVGSKGIARKYAAASDYYDDSNRLLSTTAYSWLMYGDITTVPTYGGVFCRTKDTGTSNSFQAQRNGGNNHLDIEHDTTGARINDVMSLFVGVGPIGVCLIWDGATIKFFVGGSLVGSVALAATPGQTAGNGRIKLMSSRDIAGSSGDLFLTAYAPNKAWSDDQAKALTSNPWLVFEAPPLILSVSGAPAGYTLTAASASFSVTGNTAALKADRKLAATQATFALTGNATGLKVGRKLAAATQTYAVTGNAAGLTAQRKLSAVVATYALTGIDAALTYSPLAKTLTANVGSFVLTGNAAALRTDRRLLAVTGSYALTAQAASLIAARRLAVQAGSYAMTGYAAALKADRRLTVTPASYALTGIDVGLSKSSERTLIATTTAFALTGIAASLKADRRLLAESRQIVLTGYSVGMARGYTLAANSATYALSGQAVAFRRDPRMAAAQSSYALTGYDVTMTYSPSVIYARAPSGSGYRRTFENTTRPTQQNTTRNPR
jgi:hypothetical protein